MCTVPLIFFYSKVQVRQLGLINYKKERYVNQSASRLCINSPKVDQYNLQSFTCLTRVNIKKIFTPLSSYLFSCGNSAILAKLISTVLHMYRCRLNCHRITVSPDMLFHGFFIASSPKYILETLAGIRNTGDSNSCPLDLKLEALT